MSKVIDDTLRDSFSKVVAKIGREIVLWHAGSMNLGEQNMETKQACSSADKCRVPCAELLSRERATQSKDAIPGGPLRDQGPRAAKHIPDRLDEFFNLERNVVVYLFLQLSFPNEWRAIPASKEHTLACVRHLYRCIPDGCVSS